MDAKRSSSNAPCKVGLFSIGLAAYWPQFPGLRERLAGYGAVVGQRLKASGVSVIDVGMVDDETTARAAGDRFAREDVDLVLCYVTTYATSSQVVPAVQRVGRPVLVLNLQPAAQLAYARTGADALGHGHQQAAELVEVGLELFTHGPHRRSGRRRASERR